MLSLGLPRCSPSLKRRLRSAGVASYYSSPQPLSTVILIHRPGATMKRAASSSPKTTPLSPSRGNVAETQWPAPQDQIEQAQSFIRESVAAKEKILIVPDKDADGLTSAATLRKTLLLLGLDPGYLDVHILSRGNNMHDEAERSAMREKKPAYIFVLDQGSRPSRPVIDAPHKALVIDHHLAQEGDFPDGAQHVTACDCPPVATSSLLTYHICADMHEDVRDQCDWLCILGTHGDLGTAFKWEPPFPDMKQALKKYSKKALNEAVSLINAPRRTALFNVQMAWDALVGASSPADLLKQSALITARAEVKAETERCTHAAPKFSADGRVAVLRINSPAQVHSLIATRWAGYLKSPKLEVVLVANEGYLPGMVNFSCRVSANGRKRDPPVNIIETLRDIADRAPDATLRERLGPSFARGHKEASGGIVPKNEFEELMAILEIGRPKSRGDRGGGKRKDGPGPGAGSGTGTGAGVGCKSQGIERYFRPSKPA